MSVRMFVCICTYVYLYTHNRQSFTYLNMFTSFHLCADVYPFFETVCHERVKFTYAIYMYTQRRVYTQHMNAY